MPMRRRQYVSCLGRNCVLDDEEDGVGYSRLDNNSAANNSSTNNVSEGVPMATTRSANGSGSRPARSEDDYFRSPTSYQWSRDNDQGQEEEETTPAVDQGSHNYSGVHVHGKPDKKPVKKSLPKRIRHFLRVTLKWIRRGLVTVSPAMGPQFIMNPAVVMSTATVARQIQTSKKPLVFL